MHLQLAVIVATHGSGGLSTPFSELHRNRRRDCTNRSSGHQHRLEPPRRPLPKAPPPFSQPYQQTRNMINKTPPLPRTAPFTARATEGISCISRSPAAGGEAGDTLVDIPADVATASQPDVFRTDLKARGDDVGQSSSNTGNTIVAVAGDCSPPQPHSATNPALKPLPCPYNRVVICPQM